MKHLSILLAMCVAIFATSCNDNEDKLETYIAFSQHYTVVNSEGQSNLFPKITVNYELDLTDGEVDIRLNNVQFSPNMPLINMEISDIRLSGSNSGYKFSGKNIVPEVNDKDVPEYTITSISGEIAPMYNANGYACRLSFVVNNEYTVNAYSSPMLFERNSTTNVIKTPSDSDDFSYDQSYFVVYLDETKSTATINLYNIKFAEKMPMTLNLIFKDIPVSVTPNGIELKSESITAVMNDQAQTPMDNYQITNLNGIISGDKMQLDFKCTITRQGSSVEGETYTVNNTAYLFQQTTSNN